MQPLPPIDPKLLLMLTHRAVREAARVLKLCRRRWVAVTGTEDPAWAAGAA